MSKRTQNQDEPQKLVWVWSTLIYGDLAQLEDLLPTIDRNVFQVVWNETARQLTVETPEEGSLLNLKQRVKEKSLFMGHVKKVRRAVPAKVAC